MEDFKYKGNPITDERWLLLINETEEKYSKATGIHLIKNWDNQSFNDWFMVIIVKMDVNGYLYYFRSKLDYRILMHIS